MSKRTRWTPEMDAELRRLKGDGKMWREIAAEMGQGELSCRGRWDTLTRNAQRCTSYCADCGKGLGRQNTSGRCHPCVNRYRWANDEQARENHRKAMLEHYADPDARERCIKTLRRNHQKAMADPEVRAKARKRWFELYETHLLRPEIRAKNIESIRAAGKRIAEENMAWCPPDLREEYRTLHRVKHMPRDEARAVIEQRIADREALMCLDDVVHFMRRLTPVSRCDARGGLRADGTHFRLGTAVLTPGELLRRAESKGYGQERRAA